MTGPILEIENLSFSYGRLPVLFDISLAVRSDEALALVGTNGAGKSTLLRVCSGLESPSSGTIRFDGDDVTGLSAERLVERGLVLVRGGRGVFTDMTVEENLEMHVTTLRKRSGWVEERKTLVFETFPRLAERRRQAAGNMSGGEQQQLALGKALMLEPKLLCIDELSLGLAPVIVAELMDLVRRMRADGVGVVLVEQSLNIASQLCPRAVFLEKGEVRFEGATADLLERGDIARAVFLGAS